MNKHLTYFSITLLIITILFSCKSKEDILDDITSDTNSITAKINGEDFSASGLTVTAEYSIPNAMVQTLGIVGAEIPINGVTRAIALAIVSTDATWIISGETYTATGSTKVGAGEYNIENSTTNTDINAVSSNTDVATITITAIDYSTKLVSGTFSFDAIDEDDNSNTTYQVRDGEFNDVSFE